MSPRATTLVSPRAAFDRVTMHQDVDQRCYAIDPNTVRAGADREFTATVQLVSRVDELREHFWRINVDGEDIGGYQVTDVPPFETVTDSRTITIPSRLLPEAGGTVDIEIHQIGGLQQVSRCGILEVLPADAEPVPDPGAISLDDCEISSHEVGPEEFFDLIVFVSNGNDVDVDADVVWTVQDSPILQQPGRTIPAGASQHAISAETSPELARILPGQTVTIGVSVTNADIGLSLTGSCGQLTVTGGFDSANVFVPQGQCTVAPQEIDPPQDVSLSATVVNENLLSGIAEVGWTWENIQIATAEQSIPAGSQATLEATARIFREGSDQVRAEVIRTSGGVASSPRSSQPVRSGTSAERRAGAG